MSDRFFERVDGVGSVQRIHPHHPASIGVALADPNFREVTVAPVGGLRTDSGVIERAARLLHALQWMGDQEDADAAWDRYPITSATRSDYLRTAEALAAAGLFAPIDETRVWVCGVCGHSPEAHGMPQHSSYQCVYQPILTPSDTFASTKSSDADGAERIAGAIVRCADPAYMLSKPGSDDYSDGYRLGIRDAARIARSHATPPVAATGEEVDRG